MGDKDTSILFGRSAIFIGASEVDMKPLKVVENSIELDRLSVREKMLAEPLNIEPIHFECDMPIGDFASIMGFDKAAEPSKQVCPLVIKGEPTINKPKNLKYPNKKRARRIWKKWVKRYGSTPGKCLYLPKVEIDCKIATEQDGYLRYDINARPINQE